MALDYARDLGDPGKFPYTRGIHETMYRGRLWTMRQFAGFGTAEETNERFRYLLAHGQTGLSTAFDMPTLMGYDSDHPRSLGEVGREGVAIDSLEDMRALFAGIPLGEISTSMTINAPAAILLAFYTCVADEQGVPREKLRGTIQNDILKEYIAQKEFIFPPRAVDAARHRHVRVLRPRELPRLEPDLDLGLPHPRGRIDRARRSSPSRSRTASPTSRRRSRAGSPSTSSRRASRSSSTRTSTSSRRSRSSAPRAGSGRASCASATAPATRARCAALPHADRGRLADGAAARDEHRADGDRGARGGHRRARSRSTRTPTTRRSRSRRENAVRIALRTQQVIAHESGVDRHRRPARRLVLRRSAHRRARTRGARVLRADRRARRSRRCDRAELLPGARSQTRRSASRPRSSAANGSSSA